MRQLARTLHSKGAQRQSLGSHVCQHWLQWPHRGSADTQGAGSARYWSLHPTPFAHHSLATFANVFFWGNCVRFPCFNLYWTDVSLISLPARWLPFVLLLFSTYFSRFCSKKVWQNLLEVNCFRSLKYYYKKMINLLLCSETIVRTIFEQDLAKNIRKHCLK